MPDTGDDGRPETTAACLRAVAEWLTLGDQAVALLAEFGPHIENAEAVKEVASSKIVQSDLLLLATWLDEHPDIDRQMYAILEAFPGG